MVSYILYSLIQTPKQKMAVMHLLRWLLTTKPHKEYEEEEEAGGRSAEEHTNTVW